ncbi:orotidine-5'-phosphate decarboxylase [Lentibacillus saliphilus]|uniref:orotidine-5'-phosphate decarboxylase n=1 Tax=Lentibacillus saliphilus TaxID=2737028 RepID=UPI001C300FCF|nr:orotidine-5'-phosphate decarboxylase [Lentibacillus saliphilus]
MENIYLALDFASWREASAFLDTNQMNNIPVKVGMELFYREGPSVVNHLKDRGHPVFLDLKLHDIPTTVKKAMKNIAQLGVDLVTIHASGGSDMIKQAKEGLILGSDMTSIPKLIAVTVLTSIDEDMMKDEFAIDQSIEQRVNTLATLAYGNGADGVVCSVNEAKVIKSSVTSELLTVTPGIRLIENDNDDQVRVATPGDARANGADILVVGRTITQAQDPRAAYERVMEEWSNGKTY